MKFLKTHTGAMVVLAVVIVLSVLLGSHRSLVQAREKVEAQFAPIAGDLQDCLDITANVLSVAEAAAEAGARFVYSAFGVTMRDGQREHFLNGLDRAFPEQGLGEKYRQRYGNRYTCSSPRAGKLWERFSKRCGELGLLCEMRSIISAATRGYQDRQLTFFD